MKTDKYRDKYQSKQTRLGIRFILLYQRKYRRKLEFSQ